MNQKVLLVNPPFVQLNTPYPATAFLKGTLKANNIEVEQFDLGLEVFIQLFSRKGLNNMFSEAEKSSVKRSENIQSILNRRLSYLQTIDPVIRFLQHKDPSLAHRICSRDYLPEAGRFAYADEMDEAFGEMGVQDKAKYLATLYLEDINDLFVEMLDPHFGFSRYAEKIASSLAEFDEMDALLNQKNSLIDTLILELIKEKLEKFKPSLVGFSVPFPGNLYGALKCGQFIKTNFPGIRLVMGGGYPNTELRSLNDPRIFNYLDFITLDDGETPLLNLLEHLDGKREIYELKRTFHVANGKVIFSDGSSCTDLPQSKTGIPDYSGLPLDQYISVINTVNPMHRLWNDGRWNKMMLAHGCYWGRCTFCDTSLDYIRRFEPQTAAALCDKIEKIVEQTGESGFHFIDEAAPPALLKALSLEIMKRELSITWWTNIRFEKNFTADLCVLMKKAGCIAVSGGLEVASDRILSMINKGVSIDQVARVTHHFKQAGILVHAYLMYGFPTQSEQETIDSLEIVRQLFEADLIQSGFWHRFAMTVHSPVGLNPEKFGVQRESIQTGSFANNEIAYHDTEGYDHAKFGEGLRKSLFNFMHKNGFDFDLQEWFDFKIPKTTIQKGRIQNILNNYFPETPSPGQKVIWLGAEPQFETEKKRRKGKSFEQAKVKIALSREEFVLKADKDTGIWLIDLLNKSKINSNEDLRFHEVSESFEEQSGKPFLIFWNNKKMRRLREAGLLVV